MNQNKILKTMIITIVALLIMILISYNSTLSYMNTNMYTESEMLSATTEVKQFYIGKIVEGARMLEMQSDANHDAIKPFMEYKNPNDNFFTILVSKQFDS